MSSRQIDNIEALSEQLGSLQITYKASTDDKQTDTEMAVTSQENVQAGLLKNMVPDPEWFDSNRTKFEDW